MAKTSKWQGCCERCGSRNILYLRRTDTWLCRRCGWEGKIDLKKALGEDSRTASRKSASSK